MGRSCRYHPSGCFLPMGEIYTMPLSIPLLCHEQFLSFRLHEQRAVGRLFISVHLGSSIALSRVIPAAVNESRRHSDRIRPEPLQNGPSTDSASPSQRPPRRYYTPKSQPGPSITRLTPDLSRLPAQENSTQTISYTTLQNPCSEDLFRTSRMNGTIPDFRKS